MHTILKFELWSLTPSLAKYDMKQGPEGLFYVSRSLLCLLVEITLLFTSVLGLYAYILIVYPDACQSKLNCCPVYHLLMFLLKERRLLSYY